MTRPEATSSAISQGDGLGRTALAHRLIIPLDNIELKKTGLFTRTRPVVAEDILDRLVNSAFHVAMKGKSYQPHKRPPQTTTLVKGGEKS